MKYIANVIVNKNRIDLDKTINRCSSIDEIIPSVPTLIIGMDKAKELIQGFDILKKSYPEQNLCWTFSKTERKCDYDVDVEEFYKMSLERIYKDVKYVYVNVFTDGYGKIRDFLNMLYSNMNKTVLIDDNVVMVYDRGSSEVYGISIPLCMYIGVDINKRLEIIRNNTHNNVVSDGSFLPYRIRREVVDNKHYILPLVEYFR